MYMSCLILSNYFLTPDALRGKPELRCAQASLSLDMKTEILMESTNCGTWPVKEKYQISYYEFFQ